jgi:hypothetical protein
MERRAIQLFEIVRMHAPKPGPAFSCFVTQEAIADAVIVQHCRRTAQIKV